MRVVRMWIAAAAISGLVACQTAQSQGAAAAAAAPAPPKAAAPWPGAPTVAVDTVDAPGFNVEDLTQRLAAAVALASGAPIVSKLAVRAEVAACVRLPCDTTMQERFTAATLLVHASVSRVGDVHLVTARLLRGVEEVARVTEQAGAARPAVEAAGLALGARLREQHGAAATTTTTTTTSERAE
jgi:hypothetical protein